MPLGSPREVTGATPAGHLPSSVALRGMLGALFLAICGEMVLAVIYLINLYLLPAVPWGLLAAAVFVALLWRHLARRSAPGGTGEATTERSILRARSPSLAGWSWSMAAIVAALGAFVAFVPGGGLEAAPPIGAPIAAAGAAGGGLHLTLTLLFVANYLLFAPMIEEAAFRGAMQLPAERAWGARIAVPAVAVVFSLLHLGRGSVPVYLAVALFLGTLAYAADSILPAVVAHSGFNLHVLRIDGLLPAELAERLPELPAAWGWLFLAATAATLGGFLVARRGATT